MRLTGVRKKRRFRGAFRRRGLRIVLQVAITDCSPLWLQTRPRRVCLTRRALTASGRAHSLRLPAPSLSASPTSLPPGASLPLPLTPASLGCEWRKRKISGKKEKTLGWAVILCWQKDETLSTMRSPSTSASAAWCGI